MTAVAVAVCVALVVLGAAGDVGGLVFAGVVGLALIVVRAVVIGVTRLVVDEARRRR